MAKKVAMTGTLGVMTEDSLKKFEKMLKSKVPEVQFEFLFDAPQDDETIAKAMKGTQIIVTQYQQMNQQIYEWLLPELTGVIAYGIGFNCADVESATKNGVMVANIPDYCTDEVANHTLALILAMQRRLPNLIKWVDEGKWGGGYKAIAPKKRFAGSTIGLYGFGRIPQLIAKMLQGYDVTILSHDPFVPDGVMQAANVIPVDFDTLIRKSDYLSLHAPALPGTIGIINQSVFEKMKPTSVLINTARGALVDADALYEALTTGQIDSAALDAYTTEPPVGIEKKILELPNVLSTPHVGYYSDTAFEDLMEKATDEIALMLKGERPHNFINRNGFENNNVAIGG